MKLLTYPDDGLSAHRLLWEPLFMQDTFLVRTLLVVIFSLLFSLKVQAYDPASREFESEAQEKQYQALINELRCPKCQNQNLAGSDAPIAQDLKEKTFELVKQGQTDAQIRKYMVDRYGDFVTYKPAFAGFTAGLYIIPPVLLLILIGGWLIWTRKNSQQTVAAETALTAAQQQRLDALLSPQDKTSDKKPEV